MRTNSIAAILAATLLCLSGCTTESTPDPGPRFDDEGTAEITCMRHQPHPPGARYTDDTIRATDDTLALLRYYTSHGTKPYCDGADPTETDRTWAELYTTLGADRDNVAPVLDRP